MPFPIRSRGVAALTALGLLLALAIGSVAQSATQPSTARTDPAPDTLFPNQGDPRYDVRSYRVRLHYAPETNRLEATATISARARHRLTTFDLDLEGMKVGDVRVDGRDAAWTRHGHKLVVRPTHAVDGTFTTTVEYAGVPREHTDVDGSTEGWVRTPDGAVALGEPVGAMTWLPSNNTPGDKARYTFKVTAPSSVQVAANGNLVARIRHGNQTTWTWRATDPMSTYLATIAVGKFTIYKSRTKSITGRRIPLWSFADPTTDTSATLRDVLPEVIRFEEKRFGAYPLASAGMIIDNARVGYALETQTRPFYPYGAGVTTLVHEMAHQWYGDSVTLRDWHDIWLAEGFATYAEWLWGAAHGEATPAVRFDRLYATPAENELWHPAPTEFVDPADLFGTPVYTRGAMTLQALREKVGGTDFFAILKAWAKEHRHGNARTAQFVALAERVSGEDLGTLFSDWLELDGKPTGY
ncbi:MAG: pepN 2 [Nocardioides sp.]|nr:pepN 2 [Nocardioides sp.]